MRRLFHNPLDGPMSPNKIIGIIAYVLLALISIWATSESLKTSFDLPYFIAYVAGTVFIVVMALTLNAIKEIIEGRNKSIIKLIFIVFVFLLMWAISLSTNSHKFFTQLKLSDIRKHELDIATKEIENLGSSGQTIGELVIANYQAYVQPRINDYVKEVRNPNNCGAGPVAAKLMDEVTASMPGSIFTIPSGYGGSVPSCQKLAEIMYELMMTELNKRISTMQSNLARMHKCTDEESRKAVLAELEKYNNFFTDKQSVAVKDALSKAHQYYYKLYDCYNDDLLKSIGSIEKFKGEQEFKRVLEMPVPSIELEKIAELIPFVRSQPKANPGAYMNSFWLSIAISFALDLAGLVILYFVILKKD